MGHYYEDLKERVIASGIPSDADKWVHLFFTAQEFNTAYNENYAEPWVSYTEELSGVTFNKIPITRISIENLEWAIDVPASGGTADKDNCTYRVVGIYSNGDRTDISSLATVEGTLVVTGSMIEQRHTAGTLTLTATYSGLTDSESVEAYQDAFVPTLTGISLDNLTWVTNVPATGGTVDKDNCAYEVTAHYDNGVTSSVTEYATVSGSLVVPSSVIESTHTAGTLTLTASYGGFSDSDDVVVYQDGINHTEEPLTFKIISAGTINWMTYSTALTKTIEYKLNDGEWISITSNTGSSAPTFNVIEGDEIQFRGNNIAYGNDKNYNSTFSGSTASFEVEGNIMSLIDSTGFTSATTLASAYTFIWLFRYCTGLTSAENLILPATTLARSCYSGMFYGCGSLTTTPELPATTLAIGCYNGMFQGCGKLKSVIKLPATTLASGCYSHMFHGCTGLTSIPSNYLPITTLVDSCYAYMFAGCASLTTTPELPATTLAIYCYQSMFSGCRSLTTAPSLPATTLTGYCYYYMFADCRSLTTAPELPATTLASSCYRYMFSGCASLNYIKCLATNISATNCTTDWTNGVSSTGTFVKDLNMSSWTTGNNGIPQNWTVEDYNPYKEEYLTFNIISSGTLYWKTEDSAYTKTIEYTRDNGNTWASVTSTTAGTPINVVAGDELQFRGDNQTYSSGFSKSNTFSGTTAKFKIEGNIMSLVDSTGFTTATSLESANTFMNLFSWCAGLTSTENLLLPATTLRAGCYYRMFESCASLTTAPELPATTLAENCYGSMFAGCTSLNYIKCLATDISLGTSNWVSGVASTGTFVKNPNMSESTWGRGNNGIPTNWTVQDAT